MNAFNFIYVKFYSTEWEYDGTMYKLWLKMHSVSDAVLGHVNTTLLCPCDTLRL